jgi:hypothetical protein
MRRMQATAIVKHGADDAMAITWQVSNAGGIRQLSHAGATLGQQALLTLVPSRQLAVAVLTNSLSGERLNREVTQAAIEEYLGVEIADPAPIPSTEAELAEVVGRYSRPFADVVVTHDGRRLLLQRIQKQGFPTPTSPVAPPGPPAPYAFYARDRLIAVEGPLKGARAEVIRLPSGAIGWLRVGGRLGRRIEPDGTSAVTAAPAAAAARAGAGPPPPRP